jgi:PEP-CTERM motif
MKLLFATFVITSAVMPLLQSATLFDFDGITPVTTTGTALPTGVTLQNAYYETVDSNGDLLAAPGFQNDPMSTLVLVSDPSLSGYGIATTGKALDATNNPMLFTFSSALNISNFSVNLDNSTLGNIRQSGGNPAFSTNILFYNAADTLIGFIGVDQQVAGFSVSDTNTYNNVSKVLLPSGAFYDNVNFTAQMVPEPSSLGLAALSAFVLFRRRRA